MPKTMTKTKRPATKPADAPTPDQLRARAVLANPDVQDWFEEQLRFWSEDLTKHGPGDDRQFLAGLTFLTEGIQALRTIAGTPEDAE